MLRLLVRLRQRHALRPAHEQHLQAQGVREQPGLHIVRQDDDLLAALAPAPFVHRVRPARLEDFGRDGHDLGGVRDGDGAAPAPAVGCRGGR